MVIGRRNVVGGFAIDLFIMMNKTCKKCGGKCCVGTIEVFLNDEIYSDTSLTKECREDDYYRAMIVDNQNKCIALKDGLCSIYDKRPSICKDFEFDSGCCRRLKIGEVNSHTCNPCMLVEKRRNVI